MIEVTFVGALLAGLLSFLSPCVLPLVPAYLSYISGVSVDVLRREDAEPSGSVRRHALIQSLWFIAGFSLIFIALGASATWLGQWLLSHMAVMGKIAGGTIILFGLHYLGVIRIPFLMVEARVSSDGIRPTHGLGALLLGAAFAFGWTPCVGPILGAILAIAGAQQDMMRGILLLATYSAGLAIPFLIAALATDTFLQWSSRFKRYFHWVERISGLLLLAVGLLIFLGSFSIISGWLIDYLPWLADIEASITP